MRQHSGAFAPKRNKRMTRRTFPPEVAKSCLARETTELYPSRRPHPLPLSLEVGVAREATPGGNMYHSQAANLEWISNRELPACFSLVSRVSRFVYEGWPRLRKYPDSRKRTVQASAKQQISAVVKSQFSLRSNFSTEGLRDRLPSFFKISSTFGGVLSC